MINTKEEFLKFEPCLWLPAGGCPWIPTHKTTSSTNLLVHRILEPWNWPLLENMSSLAATPGSRTVVVDKGYPPGEIFSFMAGFKSRTVSVYILLIINLSISIHRPPKLTFVPGIICKDLIYLKIFFHVTFKIATQLNFVSPSSLTVGCFPSAHVKLLFIIEHGDDLCSEKENGLQSS